MTHGTDDPAERNAGGEVPETPAEPEGDTAPAPIPTPAPTTQAETGVKPPSEPDAAPAVEASPSAPSRWDAASASANLDRSVRRAEYGEGGVTGALRVVVLVLLAGGALYAGLMAVRPDGEEPLVTVRAPRVVETRSVPREPVPTPQALTVQRFAGLRDLDLRGHQPRFVRLVPEAPEAVCETFRQAGWSTDGWEASPLGEMQECVAERSFGDSRKVGGFAVLRGGETLSELRVKLNFVDPSGRDAAVRDVAKLITTLFDRWRWDGGRALGDRIAALEPFKATMLDTRVILMREHGDVERWNLSLRFPSPPKPPEAEPPARTLADIGAMAGEPPTGSRTPR